MRSFSSGWLSHLAGITQRRTGRTTALANAAKKVKGVLVCGNREQAKMVEREHEVRTVSVQDGVNRHRASSDVLIFDHYGLETLMADWDRAEHEYQREIKTLQDERQALKSEVEGLKEQVEDQRRIIMQLKERARVEEEVKKDKKRKK